MHCSSNALLFANGERVKLRSFRGIHDSKRAKRLIWDVGHKSFTQTCVMFGGGSSEGAFHSFPTPPYRGVSASLGFYICVRFKAIGGKVTRSIIYLQIAGIIA